MKYTIFAAVLSMGVIVGCSHTQDTKRIPASAGREPCGLEGSVEERIADCSHQENARKESFVLVSRSGELKEVYKDVRSGLLWSDRLSKMMDHHSAKKACEQLKLSAVSGITGKTWRLPTLEEYQAANSNGIREALPNIRGWFWSSSVRRSDADYAWVFNGGSGVTDYGYRNNNYVSVRCVAR